MVRGHGAGCEAYGRRDEGENPEHESTQYNGTAANKNAVLAVLLVMRKPVTALRLRALTIVTTIAMLAGVNGLATGEAATTPMAAKVTSTVKA